MSDIRIHVSTHDNDTTNLNLSLEGMVLKGTLGTSSSEVDLSGLIPASYADRFLSDVQYNVETKKLTFVTSKTGEENREFEVSLKDLVDVFNLSTTHSVELEGDNLTTAELVAQSSRYEEVTTKVDGSEEVRLSDKLTYEGMKFRYFVDNTTKEIIAKPSPKNLALKANNVAEIFGNLREEVLTDEILNTSGVNSYTLFNFFNSYWIDYTKEDVKKVTLDYVVTGEFTKEDYNTFIGLVDTSQVLNPFEKGNYGAPDNYKLGNLLAKKLGISYRNGDENVRQASLNNINFLAEHNNKSNQFYYGELLIGYDNPQYSVQDIDENTVEFRFVIPNISMLVLNQKFATVTLDYTNATSPQSDSVNYVSDSRYTESLNTGAAIDLSNMPEPTVGEFTFDNGKVVFENPNANKIVIGKSNTATVA